MVESLLDDTKLIRIPKALAAQVKLVAARIGTSVTEYTSEALIQALRTDEMGTDLEQAVDMYHLVNVHKGAGLVNLPRTSLIRIIEMLPKKAVSQLKQGLKEAGAWYAAYLSSKLPRDSLLPFLANDLKVSWNLDETEIKEKDVHVSFRATSFNMTPLVTDLLVLYTEGIFEELGFSVQEKEILPGLISFECLKSMDRF